MIWFTSDQHFNHSNILKYCPNRQFQNIDDHNEYLIKIWNDKILPSHYVFILGDFALGDTNKAIAIAEQLNGKKILIAGNHDNCHIQNNVFCSKFESVKYGYEEINFKFNNETKKIVLCHYPLESFNGMRYGSFHLHGHIHSSKERNSFRRMKNRKDIGVDSRDDLSPWEKNEVLTLLSGE